MRFFRREKTVVRERMRHVINDGSNLLVELSTTGTVKPSTQQRFEESLDAMERLWLERYY